MLLFGDDARQMALGDVGDFVAEHGGELGFALCRENQSSVHPDKPAWQGKSVQGAVAKYEKFEILAIFRTGGHQSVAEVVEIVGQFGIVHQAAVMADVNHDGLADAALGLRGKSALRCLTQVGQAIGQHARYGQQREEQD